MQSRNKISIIEKDQNIFIGLNWIGSNKFKSYGLGNNNCYLILNSNITKCLAILIYDLRREKLFLVGEKLTSRS